MSRNKDVIVGLFKVFVRPIIESAGPAWNPFERQCVNEIEKVQRRATRMVPGLGQTNYEDRLNICKLTTLEHRRERGDMIHVFKMLNGFTHKEESFFCFTSQRHDVITRSSVNNFLVAERCHLDIRKNVFSNRIVQKWNSLPIEVREADSVNSFKILYDDWSILSDDNFTVSED